MKRFINTFVHITATLSLIVVPFLASQDSYAQNTTVPEPNTTQSQQTQTTEQIPTQTDTTNTVRETTTNTIRENTAEPAKEEADNVWGSLWPWLLVGFIVLVVIALFAGLSGRNRDETTVVR